MPFEFATAARVIFGEGRLREAAPAAAALGRRALLVTGRREETAAALAAQLDGAGVRAERFAVSGEPATQTVRDGVAQARAMGADLVIGLGGGSALDAGKAIAALLTNPGDPLDYLEGVGRAQPLARDAAPYIAIPTTAGTGAEVTRNAVLYVPEQRVKVSLRSPRLLPRLALIDPALTYSLPPDVTARTGLDALTQLVEPFVSNSANPLTDAVCREGLVRAARSLRRAYAGGDHAAREDMSLAALFGGLALANAKLGAVHGLAGPLGGQLEQAPHGALCGRLLPPVTAMNLRALRERAPDSPALARYAELARLLTGRPEATVDDGLTWLQALAADLKMPGLASYGLTSAGIAGLVPLAQRASSMRGNPIVLGDDEVAEILRQAL